MLNTSKIERCRKRNGFTQEQLANELGISDTTYSNLLKSLDFRASTIEKMSKLFGVTIGYLFDEDEKNGFQVQNNLVNESETSYGLKLENKMLKERIKELECRLNDKNKIIELLEKK